MTCVDRQTAQLRAVPEVATEKLTIAQAVRDAMLEEMERDETGHRARRGRRGRRRCLSRH